MTYIVSAFYFSLFTLGTLLGLVLVFKNRNSLAYTFFGIYNLITGWGFFVSFLLASGLIMDFPYFFRTAAPFHYLWGPLSYLFIRNLLTADNRFYKVDWLHFIPFLLHLIELLPFYFSSSAYKIEMLQGMMANGDRFGVYEGFLSSYWHSVIKFAQMFIYNIAQWILLVNFNNTRNKFFKESNRLVINWVTFLNTSGFIMLFAVQFHRIFLSTVGSFIPNFADIIFYLHFVLVWFYLVYKPDLLNGIKLISVVPEKDAESSKNVSLIKSRKDLEYEEVVRKIEIRMQADQPFLNSELSLAALAASVYVPDYKVSRALKHKFGLTFPEYVNRYRIAYIEENVNHNPDWRYYTVEGMAFSAGFNSRNAFYTSFRKIKGITPTDYFKSSIGNS